MADVAAVGRELAEDHFQQRGFARAIGADQADLVASQDGGGEVAHDGLVAKSFVDAGELGDHFALVAAARTAGNVHLHAAQGITPSAAVGAQLLQARDAALAARAPCFNTLANPHFFLGQ